MVKVLKIENSIFNEFTYIVINDKNDCIIIDPGSDFESIIYEINKNNLNVLGVLITHGHFDHIYSCKKLQLCGYKIYISSEDADKCEDLDLSLANSCNVKIETFIPDVKIDKNDSLLIIGDFKIKVLLTPGHSRGGLSYIIENHLFSGDTLFEHGYGRYDFYDGNYRELINSLETLFGFVENGHVLHPGH